MYFHVDYNCGEPISHQIIAQIKWMIASGSLKGGDKLPSIRELARTLKINPTTVTRIYNELAHNGIITLRQGQGAFICEKQPDMPAGAVKRIVEEKARAMLVEGIRLGLTRSEIDAIVNEEFQKIRTGQNDQLSNTD